MSKSTISPNEELTAEATIVNTFIDSSTVRMYVDERPIASRLVYSRQGANSSGQIRFPLTLTTAGDHKIRIGNRSANVTVTNEVKSSSNPY